jgi:hypothetical protein
MTGPEATHHSEAEDKLLAPLLYGPPSPRLGETGGPSLSARQRCLAAWMSMMAGRPVTIGVSDPPTTDGEWVYLPSALGPDVDEDTAAAAYRCMGFLQVGMADTGLFGLRAWMAELHQDWVLRGIAYLLMANWIKSRWAVSYPGLIADLQLTQGHPSLSRLSVGRQAVSDSGLPETFLPLIRRLTSTLDRGPDEGERTVQQVIDTDAVALQLVIPGASARLRAEFLSKQVGAPPIPFWVGRMHPRWFLEDAAGDAARANAWQKGPSPLRGLMRRIWGETKGLRAPRQIWNLPPMRSTSEQRYPEWDVSLQCLRHDAIRMETVDAATGAPDTIDSMRATHRSELNSIRLQFARLRTEARWHHAQRDGSALDLDQVVGASVATRSGHTPDPRLFLRYEPAPQAICVLTLVDLTGSSKGALLRAQRKAVLFFAEGLEALDAPHAFLGFNGHGASGCRSHRIMDWDDTIESAKKRLAGLVASGGSRLGAHIRHGASELMARTEPKRLLLVVSDGRPEDGEAYRGSYGVADTAMAVREASALGVHVHCISLDSREAPYLRTIFGPGGFTQVTDFSLLARRLPEAFCSLIG